MRARGLSRNYVSHITKEGLDSLKNPTLEDIMMFVNDGKYSPFFLQRPKVFKDGSKEFFTRKGAKVYGKLISILYACARLTDVDVEDIVETLDNIVSEG